MTDMEGEHFGYFCNFLVISKPFGAINGGALICLLGKSPAYSWESWAAWGLSIHRDKREWHPKSAPRENLKRVPSTVSIHRCSHMHTHSPNTGLSLALFFLSQRYIFPFIICSTSFQTCLRNPDSLHLGKKNIPPSEKNSFHHPRGSVANVNSLNDSRLLWGLALPLTDWGGLSGSIILNLYGSEFFGNLTKT